MKFTAKEDLRWRYRPFLWVMIALLLFFFFWVSLSEIDQHIRGVGRIIPAGKARVIQHLEGGIVESILVSEGQKIKQGETIFLIANTHAKARLKEIDVAVQTLRLKRVRLQAERDNAEVLSFPKNYEQGHAALVESQKQLFKNNKREFTEKINGLIERQNQKNLRANELVTKLENLRKEVEISNKQMTIKKELFDRGVVSKSAYLSAKSTMLKLITQMTQVEKEVPIVYAEYTELENLIEETKQKRSSNIGEEYNKVQINLKTLDEQVKALRDEVGRTAIVSPINGIVNKLHINTIGGVTQPGAPLAEITPIDETLIVEGKISTDDRGKLWIGLPVIVKISAYDYTIFGGIEGELTYISADTLRDSNSEFYQVQVTLSSTKLRQEKVVFPGMTAELNILTGKVSILHALLKPFWNIQGNALREN